MKKIYLMFALSCMIGNSIVNAQEATSKPAVIEKGKFYVSIGYGGPNYPQIVNEFYNDLNGAFGLPSGTVNAVGPFFLNVDYAFTNRITAGIQMSYSSSTAKNLYYDSTIPKFNIYLGNTNVLLRGDFHYLKNSWFDLYSGVSLGFNYAKAEMSVSEGTGKPTLTGKGSASGLGWGVNVLGAKIMFNNYIGIYSELNISTAALANAGITVKF